MKIDTSLVEYNFVAKVIPPGVQETITVLASTVTARPTQVWIFTPEGFLINNAFINAKPQMPCPIPAIAWGPGVVEAAHHVLWDVVPLHTHAHFVVTNQSDTPKEFIAKWLGRPVPTIRGDAS